MQTVRNRSAFVIVVRRGWNHGGLENGFETNFRARTARLGANRVHFASGLSLLLDERHVFGLVSRS